MPSLREEFEHGAVGSAVHHFGYSLTNGGRADYRMWACPDCVEAYRLDFDPDYLGRRFRELMESAGMLH